MRGGGVGFYIKDHLNAQVIDELSLFENKIIEALTIKLSYPDKKILSSVYRSNGPIPNVTQNQQIEIFLNKVPMFRKTGILNLHRLKSRSPQFKTAKCVKLS